MTGLPVFSVVTPRKCGFRGEIYLICNEHFHRKIFSEYREIYDITPSKKGLCSRSMKIKWEICVGRTVTNESKKSKMCSFYLNSNYMQYRAATFVRYEALN